MNLTTNFTLATFALGVVGTVLGVTNFVREIISSRVRLRIKCYPLAIFKSVTDIEEVGCIEVVNLSSYPITLKEVGFEPRVPLLERQRGRFTMVNNGCRNGKQLPVRIDPRDSVEVYYKNKNGLELMIKQSRRIIVETTCGKICFGKLKYYHDIIEKCQRNALKGDKQAAV